MLAVDVKLENVLITTRRDIRVNAGGDGFRSSQSLELQLSDFGMAIFHPPHSDPTEDLVPIPQKLVDRTLNNMPPELLQYATFFKPSRLELSGRFTTPVSCSRISLSPT